VAVVIARPIKITPPAPGAVFTDKIRVIAVRWVGTSGNGDKVEIQDPSGKTLWAYTSDGVNKTFESRLERWWDNGFNVVTLDSGTLYVDYA